MTTNLNPPFWCEKGHFNLDQYACIANLLKNKNIEYAIETGFCTGRSSVAVLNNCTELKTFISIDINFDYINPYGKLMVEKLKNAFPFFDAIEGSSRAIMTTDFFAKKYPFGIDYAMVDGDHTYDGCLEDLCRIAPNMNKGGVIVVDDYKSGPPNGCSIPDVTKACEKFYDANSNLFNIEEWNINGKGFLFYTRI